MQLQECAANHAQTLWGQGRWAPKEMIDNHIAFALSKLHIRLSSIPCWGDQVRTITWFQESGSLAARRDWLFEDAITGAPIGAATSTWLTFDLQTRRMARLPADLRADVFLKSSPNPPRWAIDAAFAPEKIGDMAAEAPVVGSSTRRVQRSDMDMNQARERQKSQPIFSSDAQKQLWHRPV